ncbi:hypothetical protein N7507_009435 [Penicillium longicatenatum]|nr:hypothetical protein N7507_009435 [Penicillium longicatenatum]
MSATLVSVPGSKVIPIISRRIQSQLPVGPGILNISDDILHLFQSNHDDLPLAETSLLLEVSSDSLLEWMRMQRLSLLPGEASKYDNILSWLAVFLERLRAFEETIDPFTADIHLATGLAYGHCSMLLELRGDDPTWLEIPFGFFYDISTPLANLLRAAKVENNPKIVEHLIKAFVDLVSLVAAVSIHFYNVRKSSGSLSTNIYEQLAGRIENLRSLYMSVTMAISMQRLQGETQNTESGKNLYEILSWLAPNDRVVAELIETTSRQVGERAELTCLWIRPYVSRFRRGEKVNNLHFSGQPGSGKSVSTQVILGYLRDSFRDTADWLTLSVSINASRLPAERTLHSIARAILYQMLTQSCGNFPFLIALSESFEHSKRLADGKEYDDFLWDTLERALIGLAPETNQIVLVVDGVDEALCDEQSLLAKLASLTSEIPNMKLITLGTHKPMASDSQLLINFTKDRVFDDISTVIRTIFGEKPIWWDMPELDQEIAIDQLTEACEGSFVWAKLASRHASVQESSDQIRDAVETLVTEKPSISDLILLLLSQEGVSIEAKHMLSLLAIAQRPLRPAELNILASISIDKQIVPLSDLEFKASLYQNLSPVSDLVSIAGDLISLGHGTIKEGVSDLLSRNKLDYHEDPGSEFLTRLFIYIKYAIENSSEPAFDALDQRTVTTLQLQNPLLQYALRYWPIHLQSLSASQNNTTTDHLEKITDVLPISTTFIRLLSTVWNGLTKPDCLSYHEIVTDLYRKSIGDDHVVTMQCMILLASQYCQVGSVDKAISLYYEAAMLSRNALTERLLLTSQLVNQFLELTKDMMTSSDTEILRCRHECLLLLVECHKLQHGDTSEEFIAATKLLAEDHQALGEERQAQGRSSEDRSHAFKDK